jgi:hypothetical protein
MTFQGDTIQVPTFAMVEIYIAEKGYYLDAEKLYNIYSAREWRSIKGNGFESLESVIDSYNRQNQAKLLKRLKKKEKVEKRRALKAKRKVEKRTKMTSRQIEYEKLLSRKEWKDFRKNVFEVRGKKCEMCGAEKHLQVHHPRYVEGKLPWDYSVHDVVVLCGRCHKKIHGIK